MKNNEKLPKILGNQKNFFVCIYKTSCEAKRLNKERKITAETYSKTETHTIRVYRKFTDEDCVIWVKPIDLQKRL